MFGALVERGGAVLSGEKISVWSDPNVVEAFRDGRTADDICVLNCVQCGALSYYNLGSWFTCRHCDRTWFVANEDEVEECVTEGRPYILVDVLLTMADVVEAECEDYP